MKEKFSSIVRSNKSEGTLGYGPCNHPQQTLIRTLYQGFRARRIDLLCRQPLLVLTDYKANGDAFLEVCDLIG